MLYLLFPSEGKVLADPLFVFVKGLAHHVGLFLYYMCRNKYS